MPQAIFRKNGQGDKEKQSKEMQEETLKRLYHKSEEERATAIAKKFNLPYLDLSIISVDVDALNSVPEEEAKKAEMAVIYKVGRKYQIAVIDPENYATKKFLEKLKKEEGISYSLAVVSYDSLNRAWTNYEHNTITEVYEGQEILLSEKDLTEFEKGINSIIELKKRISEKHTTEIFDIIVAGALKTNSSDIHIEPEGDDIRLRYRIDGVLQDIVKLPKSFHKIIVSRVKMLSKMKLNVTDMPQDGHFTINLGNIVINVRSSVLPSNNGESVVMRILPETATSVSLDELGFNQYYLEKLEEEILKPAGMVLTTGPTGSGKTTTLYSFVNRLNQPGVKIVTLENPIEYRLKGILQTEVSEEEGRLSFSEGLRAVIRQDPDIVMVGEIRDPETAETAIQAALTGHLVFSTLHTNNAAGAIPRLLHLQVKPSLIAPAINAVIGQRLVRKLCDHCKEEYVPASETIEKIKEILAQIPKNNKIAIPAEIKTIYRSKGCSKCNFIGYSGRTGIFELFTMTSNIEKIILGDTSSSEILAASRSDGMITMREDGILKALEGITSLEEIQRLTGEIFSREKFADA